MVDKICGIYTITNLVDGKIYVGRSSNIKQRFYKHKRYARDNNHINLHLKNAFNKYGIDSFKFEVLEECDLALTPSLEMYWMNLLQSFDRKFGYNKASGNPNGSIKHSLETIIYFKNLKRSDKELNRLKTMNIGRKHTEEHKQNLSKLFKNRILTEEWKIKIGEANKNKKRNKECVEKMKLFRHSQKTKDLLSKKCRMFDLNMNFIRDFNSIKEASEFLNCSKSTVVLNLKLKTKTCKGYIFKYI
jgi:group I intron endonuclease